MGEGKHALCAWAVSIVERLRIVRYACCCFADFTTFVNFLFTFEVQFALPSEKLLAKVPNVSDLSGKAKCRVIRACNLSIKYVLTTLLRIWTMSGVAIS